MSDAREVEQVNARSDRGLDAGRGLTQLDLTRATGRQ